MPQSVVTFPKLCQLYVTSNLLFLDRCQGSYSTTSVGKGMEKIQAWVDSSQTQ